jgi:alpha-beta hydrolase superfamily lysophospholipase
VGTEPRALARLHRKWRGLDFAPDRSAWAVISTPAYPSIAECHPAAVQWRNLRVDPDLVGLVPGRARPAHIGIGSHERDGLWTLPISPVLGTWLAWHPERPLVAGLAVRDRRAYPWVADYRARIVTRYEHIRTATAFTGHGGPRHPPLAWCGDTRLSLLVPPPAAPSSPPGTPSSTGRPAVFEATGPGYLTFTPGPAELEELAAACLAVLDLEHGDLTPLTSPLLVRSLIPAPTGRGLLLEYADDSGDGPDSDGLRWVTALVDTSTPGQPRPVPLGTRIHLRTMDAEEHELLLEQEPPDTAAPSAPAPEPRSFTVPTGFGSAGLTFFPAEGRDAPSPLLLWLTDTHPGQATTDQAPTALAATGYPIATLDLPLHWPSDATAEMLHAQVVDTVRTALDTLTEHCDDHCNGAVIVAGHSFGATLALYALAHIPELAAAIAHSGCYNRTHTPTGFQHEHRSYWTVPAIYHAFSALHFADRLDRPVLLVHGAEDTNPATPPEQAIDLYRGIVATGGHARLILLPHEGHNFYHLETQQTLIEEHRAWLDHWTHVRERG